MRKQITQLNFFFWNRLDDDMHADPDRGKFEEDKDNIYFTANIYKLNLKF